MAAHERFTFETLDQVRQRIAELGLDLPVSDDLAALATPLTLGRRTLANRLIVHPMEGCDGTADGSPGELTIRRYDRWASGGWGMIWFEATAVVHEGRASPRQLWLHEGNKAAFADLLARTRRLARESTGVTPMIVLQVTHSGRYSKPTGTPRPMIAHRNPILDARAKLLADYPLVTDDYLDRLPAAYAATARLAAEVGFDGVDIKACHRYLLNELLAAHERAGRYGGSYENRTRLMRDIFSAVAAAAGGSLELASRMNVYDGMYFPWGWGTRIPVPGASAGVPEPDPFVPPEPDLSEPLRLVGELTALGLSCLSVTGGNPYYRPHFNRPFDSVEKNTPPPPEHPLEGVARLLGFARAIQAAQPNLAVVGAGLSWLREFAAPAAAGQVADGRISLAGLGRGALAYPNFAKDALAGAVSPKKVCIACGACSQIMRDGGQAGCVIRDSAVYGPIFAAGRQAAKTKGLP